jgi:hypothetical protein
MSSPTAASTVNAVAAFRCHPLSQRRTPAAVG